MVSVPGQMGLFEFLSDNYSTLPDARIEVNGIINMKSEIHTDFSVWSTYRDIFLIINMLDDYVVLLKQPGREKSIHTDYMIKQFERISKELAEQIELDKEKMYKKCQKRYEKPDDVGEDALLLGAKAKRPGKKPDE